MAETPAGKGKYAPRPVVVDGEDMVALPVREYEVLMAMRRQLGGANARLRSMRAALLGLAEVAESVDGASDDDAPSGGAAMPPELAAELRRRARHARTVTGARPASDDPRANRRTR